PAPVVVPLPVPVGVKVRVKVGVGAVKVAVQVRLLPGMVKVVGLVFPVGHGAGPPHAVNVEPLGPVALIVTRAPATWFPLPLVVPVPDPSAVIRSRTWVEWMILTDRGTDCASAHPDPSNRTSPTRTASIVTPCGLPWWLPASCQPSAGMGG